MLFLLQLASTSFHDGFHKEETSEQKKNGFHLPENPFPLARMKDFVETDVSTRIKNYHYLLITLMIFNSSKIALTKKMLFPKAENSFALAG